MKEKPEKRQISLTSTEAIDLEKLANFTDVQWARVAPDKIVIATTDRSWLSYSCSDKTCFAQPMESKGSIITTRNLLDGAIAAAKHTAQSIIRPPALNPQRWVWRLAGAYHLCAPTPELMEEACIGFLMIGCNRLAEWAAQKAEEEAGHDRLALLDIQSMGYDSCRVVKALVPPAAVALIDYFTRSVRDWNPIDCVGYSYTMERLATGVGQEYIDRVKAILPPGINATRNLLIHSSVGADIEHAEETLEMVAKLSAKERTRIAVACYETALMCFSPPPEGYISDEELHQILEPLRITDVSVGKN